MTIFHFEKKLLTVREADFSVDRRKSRFEEVTGDMEII